MKKITFLLTTTLILGGFVKNSAADSYKYTPYAGVDYIYSQTDADGFKPYHNSLGIHIGSDYGKYFGTELFFTQSNSSKKRPNNGIVKTSYRSYGLDLMAYLPLGCEERFSLIATAGIGEYVYKTKFVPAKHYNEHGFGYRFGGGFKYAFDKNWQARILLRRVNFDHLSGYNHNMEYTAGVEYHL